MLGHDTVERARHVLGPDHPTTLMSAAALANAMLGLGESEQARALGQDCLGRRAFASPNQLGLIALHGIVAATQAVAGLARDTECRQ